MSFFLITNNSDSIGIVKGVWQTLFKKVDIIQLKNDNSIIITSAFKERNIYKQTERGFVFGFGTFFSDNGFGDKVIAEIDDLNSLKNLQGKGLFGHYTFVIQIGRAHV